MPQMGESIAEGTVTRWMAELGSVVERDQAILEISTDKVDAEVPAPAAGTLVEVLVQEGETVEVGTIIARIDTEGGSASANESLPGSLEAEEVDEAARAEPPPSRQASSRGAGEGSGSSAGATGELCTTTTEERLKTRSTPVVRRIARDAGVELSDVKGTGHLGRVTKQDILAHIAELSEKGQEEGPSSAPPKEAAQVASPSSPVKAGAQQTDALPEPAPPAPEPVVSRPAAVVPRPEPEPEPSRSLPAAANQMPQDPTDFWERFHNEATHPTYPIREGDQVEPMTRMRRLTAEHMVLAKRVAPHVHSVIEIDFSKVDEIRRARKEEWRKRGASVSYTAFTAWACARALKDFPSINGVISGDNIIYRRDVNLGMAVDLNPGLIVPVVHNAEHLSLVGIGAKIVDLATRARERRLLPDEIQGGTFTITNPGVLGTVVGMPVIPKGTSAILGTGAIQKRVVATQDPSTGADSVGIRKRAYFSLGYDHRLVDGAESARFLYRLKEMIEAFPEDA